MSAIPSVPESDPIGLGADPHLGRDAGTWDRLIESVGPASLIVVIASRMSPALRAAMEPEDVWQETLLHAWRDRASFTWIGVKGYRRWLLQIAENRLRDAADRATAERRGGGAVPESLPLHSGVSSAPAGPAGSTTPSRVAIHREQARIMRQALEELPEEVREAVRLRLFEDLEMQEVADRLGVGISVAKRRFRNGAESYHRRLRTLLDAHRLAEPGIPDRGASPILSKAGRDSEPSRSDDGGQPR